MNPISFFLDGLAFLLGTPTLCISIIKVKWALLLYWEPCLGHFLKCEGYSVLLLKVKEGPCCPAAFLRLPAGPGLPATGPSGGGVCHPVQPMTSRIGRVATTSSSTKNRFLQTRARHHGSNFFFSLNCTLKMDERPFFNGRKYCQRGAIMKQFLW